MFANLRSLRQGVHHRIAIALLSISVLTGAFPGPSLAGSAPAELAGQGCKQIQLALNPITYTPPRTRGDLDFKGHGPRYTISVKPTALPEQIAVEIYMKAWEVDDRGHPKSDFTTVEGTYRKVLYRPPAGWEIRAFLPPRTVSLPLPVSSILSEQFAGIDRGHAPEVIYPRNRDLLIKGAVVIGDTKGNEAGTQTGVTVLFNRVSINICPVRDPYFVVCMWNRMPLSIEYEFLDDNGEWKRILLPPNATSAHSQMSKSSTQAPWPQFTIRYDADLDSSQYRPDTRVLYSQRSNSPQCNTARAFQFTTLDGRIVSLSYP